MAKCTDCKSFLRCQRNEKPSNAGCSKFIPVSISKKSARSEAMDWLNQAEEEGIYSPDSSDAFDKLVQAANLSHLEEASEDDLSALVDSVLNDKSGSGFVPRDILIDDRELKEFPNFWEWSTSRQGGFIGMRPFARQAWMGLYLFAEMCYYCSKDKEWVTNILKVPVDLDVMEIPEHIQLLEYGVCPNCGRSRIDLFNKSKLNPYGELIGIIGQRAGKSLSASLFNGYHAHKVLKQQNPAHVYGVPDNQKLTMSMVAYTFSKANSLLWSPLKGILDISPWFKEYHALLKDKGNKLGLELVKRNELSYDYRHRNFIITVQGADRNKLRGDTRIHYCLDEYGQWPMGSSKEAEEELIKSPSGVYAALDNSMATVRARVHKLWKKGYANIPNAFGIIVSSPLSRLDPIMTLGRKAQNNRYTLVLNLPTWEINPEMPRDCAYIKNKYALDPVAAERDFGANPPLAAKSFIGFSDELDRTFSLSSNKVAYEFQLNPNLSHSQDLPKQGVRLTRSTTMASKDIPPMIMSIDAGQTNNSFAFVIGYRENIAANQVANFKFPVVIDVIPAKGYSLNFSEIFTELILPLIKTYNVQAVVTDRWNSALLLDQLATQHEVYTEKHSLKMPSFTSAKSYLEGGKVFFPKLEIPASEALNFDPEKYPQCFNYKPLAHFYLQLRTVVDTGKTVDKASGLTDDVFRSWVLAMHFLQNEEWCKEHLKQSKQRSSNLASLGTVMSRSGGGGGGGGYASSGTTTSIGVISGRFR